MINVVFLLLIFFLMTAQIAPPDPFEIIPPSAGLGEPGKHRASLFISGTGDLAFGDARGTEVWGALAAADLAGPLLVRADAMLRAETFAEILVRLQAAGITQVSLLTEARR